MSNRGFVFIRDNTTGVVTRYVTDPYLDSARYERVEDPKKKHADTLEMNDDLIEGANNAAQTEHSSG
jgi:hypothetical protein